MTQKEQRIRELIRLKLYLKKNEKMRYFVPNGGQQKWIDEISKPNAFIVVNGSGNGGGKTYGIVAALGAFFWPKIAPKCFQNPIFRDFPYPKRARIVSTPKEIEEVGSLQTAILELWPKNRYEPLKKGKSYPSQYKTDTGWVLDLMTYEQNKSEFAGPNLGLVVFNEPMPRDIWDECLARTRKGGLVLVALTSLYEHPWVVDGILGKADGDRIRVVYSDVEENCKQHGKNGSLEHDQIEKILAQYDPDQREARKTGKPLSLSGAIFRSFDRRIHVLEAEPEIPGSVAFYQSIDPAIGKPIASIWAYADSSGAVTIYDEWPEFEFEGAKDSNLGVRDYVELFKRREGRSIDVRIIDRHFAGRRQSPGGKTLKEEFAEFDMEFQDSYSVAADMAEVETGILAVKDYLNYDKSRPIDNLNCPRLHISPKCRNTIAAMERWSRNPTTGKPQDSYKDFADCVRYLVKANPKYEIDRPWLSGTKPFYGIPA